MKRILAIMVAAAMVASIVVAGLGAAGAEESSSSDGSVDPVLRPPVGQTAVKGQDQVTFGGTVPAGSSKSEAFLRVLNADGEVEQQMDVTPQTTFSDDGEISGARKLPPLDADSDRVVYVVEASRPDGSVSTGTSAPLPIDQIPPQIDRYELVGLKRVRVVFTERVDVGSENPLDWHLENYPEDVVLQVTVPDDKRLRVLELDPIASQDEDSTPKVTYVPQLSAVTKVYYDRAGNTLGPANRPSATALDRIPPSLVPEIESIGGKAPGGVGSDATPDFAIGNIREGHIAEIYEETDGEPGRTDGDPLIGEAEAGETGAVITPAADLDPDGTHTFHVAARDAAGNRTGGGTANYILDRVAPLPEYAALIDATHIEVQFTEALTPGGGNPAAWSVTGGIAVSNVSGTGDTRTLTLASPASPGADVHVTYAPADGYTDAAGNALAAFGPLRAFNGIPPVLDITVPLSTIHTAGDTGSIHGVSEGAEQVEIFRDQGNDGAPDGAPVATVLPASDGSFAAGSVPLVTDAANDFLVRGVRDEEGHLIEGPLVDVPTIVQDSTQPSLSLQAPTGAGPHAGGSVLEIRWNAADANFGSGPIRIERNLGSGWQVVAGAESNDGLYEWTLPMADTENARVRLTATDRAGLFARRISDTFTIDSTAPRFDALTLDETTIRIQFTESVSGQTTADEWRIDRDGPGGEPPLLATGAQMTTNDSGAVTELTLNTFPRFELRANDTPVIEYRPAGQPIRPSFRDTAGNRIEESARTVVGRDGIVPLAPDLDRLPRPVDRNSIPVTGTAEENPHGKGNQAIARRIRPGSAAASAPVSADGTFSVLGKLIKNKRNVFEVSIQDPSGNVSDTSRVRTVEDSIRPRVKYRGPNKRVKSNRRNVIRWKTFERHKDFVKIKAQYRAGGKKKSRLVARDTRDDGRFRWKAPWFLKGKKMRFRVVAFDKAGHRRGTWSPWLRVR